MIDKIFKILEREIPLGACGYVSPKHKKEIAKTIAKELLDGRWNLIEDGLPVGETAGDGRVRNFLVVVAGHPQSHMLHWNDERGWWYLDSREQKIIYYDLKISHWQEIHPPKGCHHG